MKCPICTPRIEALIHACECCHAQSAAASGSEPFLIYSKKWSNGVAVWWRPESKGYTDNVDEAGTFIEGEAHAIEKACHGDAIAIRKSDIASLKVRRVIDLGDANNWQEFERIALRNADLSRGE